VIGAAAVAGMLLFGMLVYRDIDLSFYTDLPEGFRALMNIAEDSDSAGLAYGAIYSSYGALTLASLALSMGAASIAGEERKGTLGLLLGNPVSRTGVLLSKTASMVALTAAGSLILILSGWAVPAILNVDIADMRVGALVLHMFVVSVFFGAVATMVGAWTGNRGAASGATAVVMVVSFVAVGLFPLIEGWEWVSEVFPWHYYDAGQPVRNGVDWGHLGVLAASSVVFLALAVVGANRRDLKERGVSVTLVDRLRANPRTRRVIEKIAGSARVSRIATKTASDHQTVTIVVGSVVLLMSAFIGPFYLLIDDLIGDFSSQFPEAILAMVGYADMGTAEGWYQTEIFSLTVPIALLVVSGVVGSRALAGEETERTIGLLLANPVRRRALVAEKSAAMVGIATMAGLLTFVGTALGSGMAGLGMSLGNIAATCLLAVLVALVFGMGAMLIGAATGRPRLASYGMAGLALVLYVANAFLPLSDRMAGFAKWSPFYYYLTSDPLNSGIRWSHAGVLAALIGGLLVISVLLFERRDLIAGRG
jgi:ABC-2 type transport system permease protein